MRFDVAKSGNGLTYEIRNIVSVANKLKEDGTQIIWENIGDPIAKGEKIPDWMKDIIADVARDDNSYAYSPTQGNDEAIEFLVKENNERGGAQITKDDVIFFNGIGDAIARSYSALRVDARIIMPEPTYSTHLLAEVLHASFPPNSYRMNPYNNWAPDLKELERKVKSHNAIVGILVINPDNPTGFVYDETTLKEIVAIAKKYDLFLIFDEIYRKIIYNGKKTVMLADLIGDVPGMSLQGVSKEFPWPGARCGWMEIYNIDKDRSFKRYINAILNQKMAEVCSTTLPQIAVPLIITNPNYKKHLEKRKKHYEKLSNIAYNVFKNVPYTIVNRTDGAFYVSVVFNESVLNNKQILPIKNKNIDDFVKNILDDNCEHDKRFVYYLLASTGICVIPLTAFFTQLQGFRITLLEPDVEKFKNTVKTVADKIVEYVESYK
ncbi:MAG: pyridoxal phosphate-dependent aminotransferase [Epsilonproteobacteria bacterium]|nr:pyridoxal phosphate-dependent aminotransferase [Campylobacterota bacterium]